MQSVLANVFRWPQLKIEVPLLSVQVVMSEYVTGMKSTWLGVGDGENSPKEDLIEGMGCTI